MAAHSTKEQRQGTGAGHRDAMAMRLRAMTEGDLPQVIRIERQCYPQPWPGWLFRRLLREGRFCQVAEVDGAVGGYGVMVVSRQRAHVMNICVAGACRKHGIGRRMLVHLLTQARREDARFAWLEVRPENHAAIKLYRASGFRKTGMRRHYYPARGGRENAILMARILVPRR
ncbi:MAG: ribosomal protein S18-alanine N-acetyltransferase [Pseudomonadota bacterium]|nr:MAG: ribosomal protein S18-alanine N-acetyltransferase [Pseudomonadota bacterium]